VTAIPFRPGRPTAGATLPLARIGRFLERECLAIVVFAALAAFVGVAVSSFVVQDTWLAFVDGRWIAQHGLPHVDELTVMTHGARWVDQQWLAQLGLYGLMRAGGFALVAAAASVCVTSSLLLCSIAARQAGASARSVALLLPVPLVVAPWLLQVRTQTLALPLFAALYALLVADSRRPSHRVYLVLPLLVLWANLHGSVALGVVLVAAHGVLHRRRRLLALLALPTICASPYGFSLVHYYHWMLLGSPLRNYIEEWKPTTFSAITVAFFVSAFALAFALGRTWRALSRFERVALPLLALAGFASMRNTTWFAFGVLASAPLLVDATWPTATGPRRLNRITSVVAIVVAVPVVATGLLRAPGTVASRWPSAGAQAVASAAGTRGLVLADDAHADWLLWNQPTLVGRVGYDVRFELFSGTRLASLYAFRTDGAHREIASPYRVLTFPSAAAAKPWLEGGRIVYRTSGFVVVSRP
jgi:hypothetical protein